MIRSITGRYSHSTSALGSCYCIAASCTPEQAEAAIDFLGLLYSDRTLADMYTYGIEGEDFEYSQLDGQAIPHITQHSDKYNHSMWESVSAMIVSPLDSEPDDKANLYIDFNGGAEVSLAAGFRFDRAPVMDAYNACRDLFEQYGFLLENGGVPADQVSACITEYQAALDAVGYQDVLAEFQRQYEDWKAENGK
jgi:putative aldouronate transport system substrate-binding protein